MRSATRRCRTSRPSPAGERQCICSRVARPVGLQRKGSRRPSRHRRMARPTLGGGATYKSCPSIDVREWHQQGRLQSGQQFSWSWTCGGKSAGSISERVESAAVVLRYRSCSSGSSECKAIEQRVPISLTTCRLGGVRPWFICPVYCDSRYCGRRAAILYCAGDLLACRRCYRLLYASQQQTPLHRALEQARKIRPFSPESTIFSSSAIIGSGPLLTTGKIPTRLTSHPIDVEAQRAIDRRATFRAGALDEKQVSRRVAAHHARLGRETIHQLQQGLRRHILQWHDRDAVAGLGA